MSAIGKTLSLAVAVLALSVVAAGCGGGGGGGVSASSYVSSICPASAHLESNVSADEQQLQTQLPSLLTTAVTGGGSAVMEQAKRLLLSFVDKSSAAAKTWQNAVRAAGTPNVKDGSSVAAALNAAAAKFVAALATLHNDVNALPTTDPTAFQQAAQAALGKFQSSSTSMSSSLQNLQSGDLNAAAMQSAACKDAFTSGSRGAGATGAVGATGTAGTTGTVGTTGAAGATGATTP